MRVCFDMNLDGGGASWTSRLAVWGLLAVAGCGGSSGTTAPLTATPRPPAAVQAAPAAASAADEAGAAVFAEVCVGCHGNTDPSRPDFSKPLTRDLASRALGAILATDMPPPTSSLRDGFTEADRASLVQWLCLRTSRSQDTCARLMRFETAPVLTRAGSTVLTTVKQEAPSPLSDDTTMLLLDSSPTNPNGYPGPRQTVRDARLVGVMLLVAIEACEPPPGQSTASTAVSEAERKRCVERILARAVEPPAPNRP